MTLIQAFFSSLLTGWDVSSILVCLGCIVFCQCSGFLWYGPFFGDDFVRLAFPLAKKEALRQDSRAYGAAMAGSALAVLGLRTTMILFQVRGAVSGAFWGVLLVGINGIFGMMHPFFEQRPFALYLIHQGYHLWCFYFVGAVLGASMGGTEETNGLDFGNNNSQLMKEVKEHLKSTQEVLGMRDPLPL